MTEMLYVVTVDYINREQDGLDPHDGSLVYKCYTDRETSACPASTPIGDIMKKIHSGYSQYRNVISVTITEDRITAGKMVDEIMAASKARRDAEQ
jgi:hypothetical protein